MEELCFGRLEAVILICPLLFKPTLVLQGCYLEGLIFGTDFMGKNSYCWSRQGPDIKNICRCRIWGLMVVGIYAKEGCDTINDFA